MTETENGIDVSAISLEVKRVHFGSLIRENDSIVLFQCDFVSFPISNKNNQTEFSNFNIRLNYDNIVDIGLFSLDSWLVLIFGLRECYTQKFNNQAKRDVFPQNKLESSYRYNVKFFLPETLEKCRNLVAQICELIRTRNNVLSKFTILNPIEILACSKDEFLHKNANFIPSVLEKNILEYNYDKNYTISIRYSDMLLLRKLKYFNDTLIDFYLRYIYEYYVKSSSTDLSVHIFGSYFYTKLSSKNGLSGIKSWTKNVNIFEKRVVIVPINHLQHWSVCILYGFDHINHNDCVKTCVYMLDSISRADSDCDRFNNILEFIKSEYNKYFKTEFVENSLTLLSPNVPKQSNSSDCGLFMLQYVESFINAIKNNQNIKFSELITYKAISNKRSEIFDIIMNMSLNVYQNSKKNNKLV